MSDAAGFVMLLGRVLFALYFAAIAGPGAHIMRSGMMVQFAQGARFPVPGIAGWPTGAWMIVGALSIGLGVWPDVGALMIGLFAIVAASYFHRFWAIEDPDQKMTQTFLFWRNVIIVGGCVFMFATFVGLGDELRYTITPALFDF